MKKLTAQDALKIGLNVAVVTIAIAFGIYYLSIVSRGELGQKSEWAFLQGTEFAHRHDVDSQQPLLLRNVNGSRYVVLGLPTGKPEFPRAWVVLNARANSGNVYILPKLVPLKLSCTYLAMIRSDVEINPGVLSFLQATCR